MRVTPQEVSAALTWGFRPRRLDESVDHYRKVLIDHVENRNVAAAFELRLGRPRDAWTPADQDAFKDYLLGMWQGGPRSTFTRPVNLFKVHETIGPPATDEELRTAARGVIEWAHDKRLEHATQELPVIASVLCTDGRRFTTFASRDERKAILKAWIETYPVFGYVMFSDAYIHSLNLDAVTKHVTGSDTKDALMMHIGSRTGIREMYQWIYRVDNGQAIFEDLKIIDKSEHTTQDPYADLFVAATASSGVQ